MSRGFTFVAILYSFLASIALGFPASSPASADPAPAANLLPAHVFAPYASPSNSLLTTATAAGTPYLTLDFLQTNAPGSCDVYWQGRTSSPIGTYAASIAALQAVGGQVIPSFGGAAADSDGTELSDSCHDVASIAATLENVITTYNLTRLDFDTEEASLYNYAGIDRRNKAIRMVEDWAKASGRTIQFVYTLPSNPTAGLDQGASYILQNAVANGAVISIVDIMTFDFRDNLPQEMADSTETIATHAFEELHQLYPKKTPNQIWAMIGICEDIGSHGSGRDDVGAAETFTLADAATIERFAVTHGLGLLTFWQLGGDNSSTTPYGYSHAFEPLTGLTTPAGTATPVPRLASSASIDPQTGSPRSVSCSTASFCVAVDQYGNNAMIWNGSTWSKPTSIDPGGAKVILNAVSCTTDSGKHAGAGQRGGDARQPDASCVAVDTKGNAISWNGKHWSKPLAIDAHGGGLTGVSCVSASFCVAVDGYGNVIIRNGSKWAAPVLIDDTGTGLESISCVSSSFCAATDWGGYAMEWNGSSWSAPLQVDPTTGSQGGGLGSVSCASDSFCMAVDWQGYDVTFNGTSWSAPFHFDSTEQTLGSGEGGTVYVSCPTASYCVAVDGAGYDYTWNAGTWSSVVAFGTGDDAKTGNGFESVSCPTTSFCMAVDWKGEALTFNGTTWSPEDISCPTTSTAGAGDCTVVGTYPDGRAGILTSVSCPTSAFCAAVDDNGDALTYNGRSRSWSEPDYIDPVAGRLTSVSCPSATFCTAVDGNGYAFYWNGKSWAEPTFSLTSPIDATGGPLESVSCSSATFCLAVDSDGNALSFDGTTWTAPMPVDATAGLTSVSCASRTFCVAVDTAGDYLSFDGTSWSAPATVDMSGGLTGVSCTSKSSCVAVDDAGNAFSFDGTSWSAAIPVAHHGGLTSASCASAASCVATDWSGTAFTLSGRSWKSAGKVDPAGGGLTGSSCASALFCMLVDWNGNALRFSQQG